MVLFVLCNLRVTRVEVELGRGVLYQGESISDLVHLIFS